MANLVWASVVTLLLVIACTVSDVEPQHVLLPVLFTLQLVHWLESKDEAD